MACHNPLLSSLEHAYRYIRYDMTKINNYNKDKELYYEVRKVQDSTRWSLVSIPKRFSRWMKLEKGSLLRVQFDSDPELGNRLIVTPLYFKDGRAI